MIQRIVVAMAMVVPVLSGTAHPAGAETSPIESSTIESSTIEEVAAELLAERPADNDSLIVAKVSANGRPRAHVIDGVDTRAEVEAVINAAESLRGETIVEWDGATSIIGAPDPRRPEQWGHDTVGAEFAWTVATGEGVVVAVVDSGVSPHPDLAGKILPGYDFVDNDTNPSDLHGHGTHVAGIVAAVANNGIGIVGAAPGATILPVRVLNAEGRGTWSATANAITWAVDNGADVINLSLGAPSQSLLVTQAIDFARSRGVVVVAAAGNDGDGGPVSWPGAEPGVLGVAAAARAGGIANFSTRGAYVDVAAPGVEILSTLPDGSFAAWNGTSMATPYVAGLAALLREAHPDWSEARIRDHIQDTATDIAPAGPDTASGAGLVSFSAAIPPAPWPAPAPGQPAARISGLDVVVSAERTDFAGVTGYQLVRNGDVIAISTEPTFTDAQRATINGSYQYAIHALNALGQRSAAAVTTLDVSAPAAPQVTATVEGTTVTLAMSSTGTVAPAGWMVQRNGTSIATTTDTAPVVITNNAIGTHTFAVRAVASTGVSGLSNPVTAQVLPAAPAISARRSGLDTVVSAGPVAGATAYEFTRNGTLIATGPSPVHTDAGRAQTAGTVVYGVRATVSGVKSAQGTVSHVVSPPSRPSLSASPSGADLRLTIDAPGASEVMIYRDGRLDSTVVAAASVTVSGAARTPATWTVRSANETGVSAPSSAVEVTTPVPAPATLSVSRSGVDVFLEASRSSGVSRYEFFRDGVLIGTARSTRPRFTDTNRSTVGGTYEYSVRAVNSSGVSSAATVATWTVTVPATPVVTGTVNGQIVYLTVSAPGASSLDILRNGSLVATRAPSTSLVLAGQPYGTNVYTVRATTATGVSGTSAALTLAAPVPAPRSLSVSRSGTNIVLRAGTVAGVEHYDFYRDGVLLGRSRSSRPEFVDLNGATVAGTRTYAVRSVTSSGLMSGTILATWTVTVPTVPALTVSSRGNVVSLDISAPGATAIDVLRNGFLVTTKPASSTLVLSDEPYGEHAYSVRAATATGVSAPSPAQTARVSFEPAVSVTTSGSDVVIGALPISGARRWEMYRDGTLIAVGSRPSFRDAGRKAIPGDYEYGLVAILRDGTRSQLGTATFTVTSPATPVILGHSVANRSYATLALAGDFSPADSIQVFSNGRLLSTHAATDTITLPRLRRGTYSVAVRLETGTGFSPLSAPITVVTS